MVSLELPGSVNYQHGNYWIDLCTGGGGGGGGTWTTVAYLVMLPVGNRLRESPSASMSSPVHNATKSVQHVAQANHR